MSIEYDSDTGEDKFLEETYSFMIQMIERYPEVKELSQILFLMGGNTIVFDGWGKIPDLENLVRNGKIVEVEDVSMDIVKSGKYDCMQGFCWSNTAEVTSESSDLIPVYTFALNTYYPNISFWMEHFIVKNIKTGKYYEATDIDSIEKYFAIDISYDKMIEMEGDYSDYDV